MTAKHRPVGNLPEHGRPHPFRTDARVVETCVGGEWQI